MSKPSNAQPMTAARQPGRARHAADAQRIAQVSRSKLARSIASCIAAENRNSSSHSASLAAIGPKRQRDREIENADHRDGRRKVGRTRESPSREREPRLVRDRMGRDIDRRNEACASDALAASARAAVRDIDLRGRIRERDALGVDRRHAEMDPPACLIEREGRDQRDREDRDRPSRRARVPARHGRVRTASRRRDRADKG